MTTRDAIVIGLGIMGAAALDSLATLGLDVLGIEAFGPSHTEGSSHGATRIFRRAYWEGVEYSPSLDVADGGWRDLERRTSRRLIVPTGGLFIGPRHTNVVAGSLATARATGIPHEELTDRDMARRFPQFRVQAGMHAIYEPGAYAILADEARLAFLTAAVTAGAELSYGKRVTAIEGDAASHLVVRLNSGERLRTQRVIVTTGPWIAAELLPELQTTIEAKRVTIYWFQPPPGSSAAKSAPEFPIFLYETTEGELLYGFPSGISADVGVKVGFHNRQQLPTQREREIGPVPDVLRSEIARSLRDALPGLGDPIDAKWCYYTLTPDEKFLIGSSIRTPSIVYASACSGHGFKFAPAIGQAVAQLSLEGLLPDWASPFRRRL